MPKTISLEKKDEIKERILKILGVNGRISIRDLSKTLKVSKTTAHKLFSELVKERNLYFTVEIGVEELWRWEFVKQARTYNKKGILEKVIENLPELGFEEFVILFKFLDKKPTDDELVTAIGTSYIPQFMAKLHGDHDMIIYGVARGYDEINRFIIDFNKHISKYNSTSELLNIRKFYGFFPLRQKLLEQFEIQDTYKHIILGLNTDGRTEFSGIAKKFKHGLPHTLYAYDRLLKTGILTRLTYYEKKPENAFCVVIQIKIINESKYFETREKWFLDMVRSSDKAHTEYTFICDISNPDGGLVFMNFRDGDLAERYVNKLMAILDGVEIKYTVITSIILGNMGVRDFDMKHSTQHKILERKGLLPKN
ncbi:MAG: winged helix-turn-helix transcriptional regulator [Candidatus Micrarchaeota archaeon]|nr:winged helix-turn-helix transcriptional regulator [Candidatus Micrarchaeota archaeon]